MSHHQDRSNRISAAGRDRGGLRLGERLHALSMGLLYGLFGLAGLLLWLLMHLPMSGRVKESVVYAMAGCLGLFAMGWRMLRPAPAAAPR